jgi:hypothetical protein
MDEPHQRPYKYLASEEVLWVGGPKRGIPRARLWVIAPALCFALAAVVALFSGLVAVAGIPAVRSMTFLAFYLSVTGISWLLVPRYLLDACQYTVTDAHVIWQRGQLRRVIERKGITYGRIQWHRSVPGIGSLELVRATPFGPFSGRQRVVLHDVEGPDRLFALIRGATPGEFAGYGDVPLTDRLDQGERVVWGSAPAGYRLGRVECLIAAVGVAVLIVGVVYVHKISSVVLALERSGLPVRSATWMMLFLATLISSVVILVIGATLLWKGFWGARRAGSASEYILTEGRVLIRRGDIELSVDRSRIVDVAEQPSTGDLGNLYLILDGPRANALDDSGALGMFAPARSAVLPVLYEVRDRELFRRLLFAGRSALMRDAA